MTFAEAKLQFAQSLAKLVSETPLPATACRKVLVDIDMMLAQMEEQQFQKSLEGKENDNG